MRKTIAFIGLIALMGCKTKQHADSNNSTVTEDENTIEMKAKIGSTDSSTAYCAIEKVSVNENTLYIDVSYSGGCNTHTFRLLGSPAISKSLPPIRSIQLFHNNNGDNCKAIIHKTLAVDITELAYKKETGSVIYLSLDGWKERITYTFK